MWKEVWRPLGQHREVWKQKFKLIFILIPFSEMSGAWRVTDQQTWWLKDNLSWNPPDYKKHWQPFLTHDIQEAMAMHGYVHIA